MKVTEIDINLSLNKDGEPVIIFWHTENTEALSEKTLGLFINKAKEGLELVNRGDASNGCLKKTCYEIRTIKQN